MSHSRECGSTVETKSLTPNQRLKLTEITVDDFAARCGTISEVAISHARIFYPKLAARRRSLAAIR